jgi:hypothetical protein
MPSTLFSLSCRAAPTQLQPKRKGLSEPVLCALLYSKGCSEPKAEEHGRVRFGVQGRVVNVLDARGQFDALGELQHPKSLDSYLIVQFFTVRVCVRPAPVDANAKKPLAWILAVSEAGAESGLIESVACMGPRIGSINRLFWNSAKYQWLQIGAVFGRYGCGSIGIPPPVCRKPCPPPPK